jgi:general stress protein CsbA
MKDKLKVWLNELVTSSTKVSSKRIVAIFVTINLIILSYVATFTYYVCPIAMFDTLALLTGGLFGGTVIERFTKQKSNGTTTDRSAEDSGGDLQ